MEKISKIKIKKGFKISFAILSSLFFLAFTKIKFGPILGTNMKISISVFFGPTLAKIFGIKLGTGIIFLTHFVGIIFGLYKLETLRNLFLFFPILFSAIYFSRIFKNEKRLILIPSLCILLFILHPIGRTVWFYAGFWIIPILISISKNKLDKIFRFSLFKIYGYSLGSTFVDHAVGSVIYLYFLNIPAHFWTEAIPLTITERLLISGGITIFYFAELLFIKAFKKALYYSKLKKFVFEKT